MQSAPVPVPAEEENIGPTPRSAELFMPRHGTGTVHIARRRNPYIVCIVHCKVTLQLEPRLQAATNVAHGNER